MSQRVRDATPDDLDGIMVLARRRRQQLAGWQPRYWNPAPEADVLHRLWLDFLIQADTPTRVVADGDELCAFAVSVDQGEQTFVDDLAVAPGQWPDAGALLLASIPEEPAVICVPAGDHEAHAAAAAVGVEWVSSYWLQPEDPGYPGVGDALTASSDPPDAILVAPPHTMKSANPHAPPMVVWTASGSGTGSGSGVVVASPPVPAPPVYDPGGTTCVIDRVAGPDPGGLLAAAVRTATDRGDVQVLVVAGAEAHDLLAALAADGWRHASDIGRLVPHRP